MNFDNSFRGVFDRTFRRIFQMVQANDMASKNSSEENRRKSEPSATNKRAPHHPTNTRAERRALRSKPAIPGLDRCTVTSTEESKEKGAANGDTSSEKSPVTGSYQESLNCRNEIGQLRQLLLLHLELIQQQQEDLQQKDRDLNKLKLEKEQLESRMHRMERRMAVKKRRDFPGGIDIIPEDNELKPAAPKNRRLSAEQLVRSKRVPAAASVTLTSQMCEDTSYDTNLRTELLYLHNKPEDCVLENNNDKKGGQKEVQVPRWKKLDIQPLGKLSTKSGRSSGSAANPEIEAVDDDVYNKRHLKHEIEEKRRKRWDVQQARARQVRESLEKKLQEREEARLKGSAHKKCKEPEQSACCSFLPTVDDVMAIEVSDTVPVTAFGSSIPLFHTREFEVPWFSLDRRELQERRGKVKPGRKATRGRRKKI